jgi:nucleoside-diphosphate-sugar epimerase
MASEKIFITGGSGYIGSVIITLALASGYTITALSRSPTSDEKLRALGATPVRGHLKTYDVLTQESTKADIVIHLADLLSDDFTLDYSEVTKAEYGFCFNP